MDEKELHKLYVRKWNKLNPEKVNKIIRTYRRNNKNKKYAWHKAEKISLDNKKCEVCNGIATERHHPNYSKPLEIIFLCRKCHQNLHKCIK